MRAAGEVGAGGRQPDPDEAGVDVAQRAGGGDAHHLVGFVAHSVLQPGGELLAVLGDRVPVLVGGVVAVVVVLRVGRLGAAGHVRDAGHDPARQDDGVRLRLELVDDLLDRDERRAWRRARSPSARRPGPRAGRCRCRSACWAWMIPTSRSSAGTAVSCSPVNGQVIGLIVSVCSGSEVPL